MTFENNSGNLFPPGIRVMVVGDVMLDRYICGKSDRLSPEAPVPVVDFEKEYSRPGGAANVALNLKDLGVEVALCGICGRDRAASLLTTQMRNSGVDVDGLILLSKRNTTEKIRILGNGKQLLRVDKENTARLDEKEQKDVISTIEHKADEFSPDIIILQDYNKGLLNKTTISQILSFCSKKGVFTAADPKFENFFQYQGVDLFKPNLKEFSTALDRDVSATETELERGARELIRKLNPGLLMVTLGEQGIFVSNGDEKFVCPAVQAEIEDVSGAGDTVLAVASLGLYVGMGLSRIAELSNLAAAVVCGKVGVVSIRQDQLLEKMKKPESGRKSN